MKSIILALLLCVAVVLVVRRHVIDRVEQQMVYGVGVLCNNDASDNCYVTFVWKGRTILEAWYDNPNTLNDSIKNSRIKEGLYLLNNTETKTTYK